ncbi:MAG: hypothetical protein N3D09_01305 [Archaeoglobaceae archaeon]|nr:hypothetical protein [Archaeoglobaceae archaeon]
MIHLIESLRKAVIDNIAYDVNDVHEKLFGGFCDCGGMMFQKFWLKLENTNILISECEKCWKNHAYVFNSMKFMRREEVKVVEKGELVEYLRNFLTDLELEAVVGRAQNKLYKPQDLARAKKKLFEINLPFETLVNFLR